METDHQSGAGRRMIAARIATLLSELSRHAETNGCLTSEQLAIIYDQRWFKLFVPKQYGGLELTVPEGVRLEEELACIDGSLGWTVTLCAGANLFVGYIDPSVAASIFSECTVCFGGSGQASGRAVVENGGYRITGVWRYATGAPHLTHFTVNCVLEQRGVPLMDDAGNPLVRSFFLAKDNVRIIEDWKAFGLKATASHSFEIADSRIDESQAFTIAPERATFPHPTYRYPFLQFAEVTLAANTLGMARHFVACVAAIDKADAVQAADMAQNQLVKARELFLQVVDASWDELQRLGTIAPSQLQAVSDSSRALVHRCRQQVMALYPLAGMVAADAGTEINRIWRDIFTASQHSLLR
ncbi:acyl-CoA dehydrogenase [Parapedobacter sp. ISTM3]|uniref:acyl-CoA dehydrogenase n=1 Tax=Parapedobacter sp. ISTM3 TaxID=2800130 RepID=UPI001905C9F2|nr:acyl-CoA dehydrogenase [Parapedobacter sp. ISTM3]MBK1441466.1 acyl-CoA dehydrogenase [Parapedobacter sp. ISTM3]